MKRVPWWILAVAVVGAALVLMLVTARPRNVVRVNRPDPRLEAAIDQARRGLPKFAAEVAKPKPGERFAVMGRFNTATGPEYLWVRDVTLAGDAFVGTLDQVPIAYRAAQKGDAVTVARANVVDWLIVGNGDRQGGFTQDAVGP